MLHLLSDPKLYLTHFRPPLNNQYQECNRSIGVFSTQTEGNQGTRSFNTDHLEAVKETRNPRPGLIATASTDHTNGNVMSGLWVIHRIYSEGRGATKEMPDHHQVLRKKSRTYEMGRTG